ncbi:MAG: VWA-like domain-containing protein [Candidatus Paceibacterota bacterium]
MSTLLAQARLRACRYWPFASHAILSMVPTPRPGLGTLAVDQHWRLYYDEAALQRISLDQAAGLILHELDHLLKRHHKRGQSLVSEGQWEAWNYATDATINGDLRDQDIPLPEGVVYPERLNLPAGLSAEEYYRKLTEQTEQPESQEAEDEIQDSPSEEPGDSDDNNEADNQNDGQDSEDEDREPGDDAGDQGTDHSGDEGASEPIAGSPDRLEHPGGEDEASQPVEPQPVGASGSCSDGQQRPWELGPPDDDNPGLEEADQEQLIHVTAKNVLEREHGQESARHRRWASDILNPPIDPAARLLHLVRRYCDLTVGIGERSYRRPSRRNGDPRMVLPSNVAPLPRITVIVDTSGSMSEEDLGLSLGMIRKVLNSFRIRDGIRVVTGDRQGQTKQLCLSDPKRIELTGGGGTNMAAIVAEVLESRPQPQMILVCTDGYTPWPEQNPGLPVVACLSNRRATLPEEYQPPSWISVIELAKEN